MRNVLLRQAAIVLSSVGLLLVSPLADAKELLASDASKQIAEDASVRLAFTPKEGVVNVDLSHVRDWGLAVRQLKEQAMNLYIEATRIKPTPDDSSDIKVPESISTSKPSESSKSLPPRTEWVAYYLNSMEPLMQFVTSSLRASEGGKLLVSVPKGTSAELRPIGDQMYAVSHQLEGYLDMLNDIFNQEQPSGDKLTDLSAKISDDASKLEGLRKQYYEVIRKAEKNGVTETEIVPRGSQ